MESHLLQMRGLKPIDRWYRNKHKMSHLLQMRGLKLNSGILYVVPSSRIFYRCVD